MIDAASIEKGRGARLSRMFWWVSAIYVVGGLAARLLAPAHADAIHMVHATRRLLDGSLAIYAERHHEWAAPPFGLAVGYPPLYAMVFAPFVALADLLQHNDILAARLTGLPMLLFDVLAVHQCCAVLREQFPQMSDYDVGAAAGALYAASGMISASWLIGHPESMVVCFLLIGWRQLPERPRLAGAALGLAFLSKQTAALPVVGLLASLRGDRIVLRPLLVALIGTVAIVFAPFVASHPAQAAYALVTAEARREIGGVNLWRGVSVVAHRLLGESDAYVLTRMVILRSAHAIVILTALGIAALVWRRNVSITGIRGALAAMASCASTQLVLGKWVDAHYFVLPMTCLILWDCARRDGRFPAFAASLGLMVQLAYLLGFAIPLPLHAAVIFAASLVAWGAPLRDLLGMPPPRAAKPDGRDS